VLASAVLATAEVVQPQPALAVASLVAAAVGAAVVVALAARNAPRRVQAGPLTQELRPEPPAVVDLLVGGFEPGTDAVAATLVDLAARRHLDIEEVAGGNVVIRRRARPRSDDALTDYEQRVLRHVETVARGRDVVPAEMLTTGPRAVSARWRSAFSREVIDDARARGLSVRRWGALDLAAAWGVAGIAVALLVASQELGTTSADPAAWGSSGTLLWALALGAVLVLGTVVGRVTLGHSQRDTDEGLAAARHWAGVRSWYRQGGFASMPASHVRLWDRHLAYATAMDAAPTVERQLCFDAEHDRRAWSHHGDALRRVRVRYWSPRPGWGKAPWVALIGGAAQASLVGAVLYWAMLVARDDLEVLADLDPVVRQRVGLGALVLAAVLVPVGAWCAVKAVLGLLDLFPRRTAEGLVVRARVRRRGVRRRQVERLLSGSRARHGTSTQQPRPTYHLAVDDGTSDRLVTLRTTAAQHRSAPQGSRVRLRITPLLGHVRSVELLEQPPAGDAEAALGGGASIERPAEAAGVVLGLIGEGLERARRGGRRR
jgi:hypothetical protein